MADTIDENEQKENLSSVLDILQTRNLISKNEKDVINLLNGLDEKNGKIYQLLMKKDLKVSLNILLQMRLAYSFFEGKDNDDNKDWDRNQQNPNDKNPLKTNTIVQEIFKYLNLEDLKAAGTVCHKWNQISQPFIRVLSEIRFENPNLVPNKTITDWFSVFRKNSKFRGIPFTSINFFGYEECYTRKLTNFFRRQGESISELTLYNIHLKTITKTIEHYDISNWIADMPLKKLHISCPTGSDKTKLHVSLYTLTSVEDLLLDFCIVDVSEVIQVSPKKIVLSNVSFYCGEDQPLVNFRLNDAFNFDGADYLEFAANQLPGASILDFCENVTVGSLKLISAGEVVQNWDCSRWKVNHLKLVRTPFIIRTQMRFRELHVHESCLDLCVLRQTIEKLVIESSDVLCDDSIVLTKLKYLQLRGQNVIPFLSKFANCYELADVELYGYKSNFNGQENCTFDSYLIPRNIKRLKLYCVKISGNNWNIPLHSLILQEFSFNKAATLLMRLKPKMLVLNWKRNFEINDCTLKFLNNKDTFDIERMIIGPFIWDDFPFPHSNLAKYVDKEGKYYCFEGNNTKNGKSLSQLEFTKMQEL